VNHLLEKHTQQVNKILNKYPEEYKRSAVMPLLVLAQKDDGFISKKAINDIAEILDITSTEVASIVGFYTLFHDTKEGKYRIQVCTDLPCAMRGSEKFLKDLCEYLEVEEGETTVDGLFTVEAVKCIAACHKAPVFQIQGNGEIRYHEEQSMDTVKLIIEGLREKDRDERNAEEKNTK